MRINAVRASWTVRRLDVSATLRAFTLFFAIASGWTLAAVNSASLSNLVSDPSWREEIDWEFLAAMGGIVFLAALSPFSALVIDWMARRSWRAVSGFLALFSGALLWLLVAAAVAATVTGASILAQKFGAKLLDPESLPKIEWTRPLVGNVIVNALLYGTLALMLLWGLARAHLVETSLASLTPRRLLLGEIRGGGLLERLAYLFGLPSSQWRLGAVVRASFWMFLLARPVFYLGVAHLVPLAVLLREAARAKGWLPKGDEERDRFGGFDSGESERGSMGRAWWDGVSASLDIDRMWVIGGAAALLLLLGLAMFALGKRLAARRIWDAEKRASKPPILFLRSFKDDQFRFRRSSSDLWGLFLDLWSFRRNVDELLIDEFAQYGEVIALGRPGEKHAPFGAARRYTSDEEWQAVIADAAERAQAIIVAAGDTPGLGWEYDLIKREKYFGKTIFLFPAGNHRASALSIFADAFPEAKGALEGSSRGLFAARLGDSPRFFFVHRPRAESYLYALRTFFQEDVRGGP